MSDPLTNIESATVELRLPGGVTYAVEFKNAVVPLKGSLDIQVEPVEGPPTNGYRTFSPGPMLGDLTLRGYVEKAERTTRGPNRAGDARRIVARRFQDERGVDPDIAAERILNDLAEAGHLPSTYAADTRGAVVNDLISWLRQQLDTDEQTARSAPSAPWTTDGESLGNADTDFIWGVHTEGFIEATVAAHAARHDPDRVLRQVQAHRAILDEYERRVEAMRLYPNQGNANAMAALDGVVRLLASIYSDRDGYNPEWSA